MGYLELIIGPMFSGKTSKLIELYNEHTTFDDNIIAINYDNDTRYSTNSIVSHDGDSISAFFVNNLNDLTTHKHIFKKLKTANYIFINEAQFFKNLKSWVLKLVDLYDKNVILCGLDSDFKREKFGEILDLIPHADKITKLNGNCKNCKNLSMFTHRISNETEQEVVGIHNYIPVCRKCYCDLNFKPKTITYSVITPQNTNSESEVLNNELC